MTKRPLRIVAGAITAAAAVLIVPAAADAHGLVGRADLPIPGWLFAWAAAAVLAVSFFAFALFWQEPVLETNVPKERFTVPIFVDVICGVIGVAIMVGLIYAGFHGSQFDNDNVVPTFIYVFF